MRLWLKKSNMILFFAGVIVLSNTVWVYVHVIVVHLYVM